MWNLMKSKIKAWLLVLVSLLDDAAIVTLIFLGLWFFHVPITWPIIIFIIIVFAASVYITDKLIVPVFQRRKENGVEGMVGLVGKAINPLNPIGMIKAKGELWKARALDGPIPAGEKVKITGAEGLTLLVKRLIN
jgi:membrane-bound ClpP family serine protease